MCSIVRYLRAKCKLHINLAQVVFQEIEQALIKRIVERLQVSDMHSLTQDVFVEGACKETVQQLVVINRLGNDPADEFKVAQVVRVAVGQGVGLVGDAIPRGGSEQGVVGVEHLPGHDNEPLSE